MAECLVGLCHLVSVLTLLHCPTPAFGGVHELTGQAQIHRLLATLLGGFTQPAHGKGQAAHRAHFNRHLIVRATYTAAFHFNDRLDVVNRGVEHLDGLFASFSLNLVEGAVDNTFGDGLFARQHNNVHEFGELYAAKFGIGENFTLGNFATTRHFNFLVTVQLNRFYTATTIYRNGHLHAMNRLSTAALRRPDELDWEKLKLSWGVLRRTWSGPACGL